MQLLNKAKLHSWGKEHTFLKIGCGLITRRDREIDRGDPKSKAQMAADLLKVIIGGMSLPSEPKLQS